MKTASYRAKLLALISFPKLSLVIPHSVELGLPPKSSNKFSIFTEGLMNLAAIKTAFCPLQFFLSSVVLGSAPKDSNSATDFSLLFCTANIKRVCPYFFSLKSTGIFRLTICFLISAVSSFSTATAKGQAIVFSKSRKSSPNRFWLPYKLHEFNISTNKDIMILFFIFHYN